MIEHLTVETFKEKVFDYSIHKEWKFEGEKPAIIDFYADWCGPCKMVSPILEELANEYEGKMDFYKIDTEDQKELASITAFRVFLLYYLFQKASSLRWPWALFQKTPL